MKTRNLFQFVSVLILLCCSLPALAQQKRFTYDGGYAATYARNNAWMAYGPGYNQNPFFNFPNNCANFVSQAIMAGMVKKTNPTDVFYSRYDFLADLSSPVTSPRWFFLNPGTKPTDRGPAWQGAPEMYAYATYNKATYKGLHLVSIASDTPSQRTLDPNSLRPGDVLFCDWENNGTIDHVMMIERIDKAFFVWNKYNRILVAGQSNNHSDTTLQWIIDKNFQDKKTWASFKVFRPTDYNQAGR
jgi:hypothetical protein